MAMEHKAFVFDYEAFKNELSSILENALKSNNTEELVKSIQENLDSLKDPYEGEPLDSSWEDMVEPKDAHQYGDFAITKYYDPKKDIGLGYKWESLRDLPVANGLTPSAASSIILGQPFGPPDDYFDPGKIGSYFQSPEQVQKNLQLVEDLVAQKPELATELADLIKMLKQATEAGKGLYLTF